MVALAGVSRASYYRFDPEAVGPVRDVELRDAIQRIALRFPAYGRPRITAELKRQGWAVNHKRVGRILREDNRWLVPVEFLSDALTLMTGTEFHYRPGTSRIFVGAAEPPELEMNAQTLGPITRLTIRCGVPIKLEARRDETTKVTLAIDRAPVDPARERFDHRDRLLRTIAFDDSDGNSKILLEITRDVADLRVTPADNNRIYFVDLLRKGDTSAEPPPTTDASPAKPDALTPDRKVRVVVIDPGHGGEETGAIGPDGRDSHQHDIRVAHGRLLDRGAPVRGLTHDLVPEPRRQYPPQALSQHRMIINDEDANRHHDATEHPGSPASTPGHGAGAMPVRGVRAEKAPLRGQLNGSFAPSQRILGNPKTRASGPLFGRGRAGSRTTYACAWCYPKLV